MLRTLCVWAVTLPTTTPIEFAFLCLCVLRCLLSWERTGHLLWRAIYLEGSPRGGLFFVCVCFLSPRMDPFSSLPDGLRHFYGDHNPYSILHIPYSMLYVIYDLEGSNDVNLQSTEFDPCR